MDLVNYEIIPQEYGQVRFFPLYLANVANTALEEWFVNFKYLHFAQSKVEEEEFFDHRLNIEYSYSRRIRERDFQEIETSVERHISRCMFQDLFRILVDTLETANKIHEIAITKKTGKSVIDFKSAIDKKVRDFHRKTFPEKVKKFEIKENFIEFLDSLKGVNKARNCLEHRNGIVGNEDCNSGDKLIL